MAEILLLDHFFKMDSIYLIYAYTKAKKKSNYAKCQEFLSHKIFQIVK